MRTLLVLLALAAAPRPDAPIPGTSTPYGLLRAIVGTREMELPDHASLLLDARQRQRVACVKANGIAA